MKFNFFAPKNWIPIIPSLAIGSLMIGLTITVVWSAHEMAVRHWKARLLNDVTLLSAHAEQVIVASQSILEDVSKDLLADVPMTLDDVVRYDFFQELRSRAESLPQIDVISVVNLSGKVINYSRSYPPPEIHLDDREYFIAHMKDTNLDVFLSSPVVNRGSNQWTFYFSKKIKDRDGKFIGLLLVGMKSKFFSDFYAEILGTSSKNITLLRDDGIVMARHPDQYLGEVISGSVSSRSVHAPSEQNVIFVNKRWPATEPESGTRRLVAVQHLKKFPLISLISTPEEEVLKEWRGFADLAGAAGFFIAVVLSFLTYRALENYAARAESLRKIDLLNGGLRDLNVDLERQVQERTADLAASNQALQDLVRLDPLTGFPNRRAFDERLKSELSLFERFDVPFCLMLLDIDYFKRINDCYGHDVGDAVLRDVSQRFHATIRTSDFAARVGGEEFAIILSNTEAVDGSHLATRLGEAIAQGPLGSVCVTVTIGLAQVLPGDAPGDLYRRADQALYRGKNQGRNCVVCDAA